MGLDSLESLEGFLRLVRDDLGMEIAGPGTRSPTSPNSRTGTR